MKTVTINTSGKRANAYITNWNGTNIISKEKISVKSANDLINDKSIFTEGFNFKSYKL